MKRKKLLSIVAAIIIVLIITPVVNSITINNNKKDIEQDGGMEEYALGEAVVGFHTQLDDLDPINVSMIDSFEGHNIIEKIEELNIAVVEVDEGGEQAFIDSVRASPFVKYAELNYFVHAFHTPNDPKWNEQWGPKRIHCEEAWDITQGSSSVKIAVVDTGIDYNHEDLSGNYVSGGYDHINNDNDPMDDEGHGSHCAGIAAAVMDNNKGIAGVAQVSVMAEKVLDSGGSGTSSDVAAGITHASNHGADIISMSLGSRSPSSAVEDACNAAYNAGVLLVAASGNDYSSQVSYPAAYNSVIAVGAINDQDERCSYSNYGYDLELMAPGEDILSVKRGGGYVEKDGTSMACPHVSGVAALVKSSSSGISNVQIRQLLRDTAEDLGAPGWDIYYAYGLVDARAAGGSGSFFEEVKCGTETSKRSGDIYNYNSCQVSMGEHIWGGDATAWYEFDIGDVKVAEGMEVGVHFADWGWIGDGPNLYVYNWESKTYTRLGKDLGNNDEFKWVWKQTSNSNEYVSDNGIVEVKVWAEDDDWVILYHVGVKGQLLKPHLKCSGNLHFGYIAPGQSVTKSIKVENDGDSGTELDWKVYTWPSWGTWAFTPSSGDDLRPEDGPVIVTVKVVAPITQDDYTGKVKIINENDNSDNEIIDTSLSTRRSKESSNTLITFLQEKFQQLLSQFPLLFIFLNNI
jgi:hypothetical protein